MAGREEEEEHELGGAALAGDTGDNKVTLVRHATMHANWPWDIATLKKNLN